MAAKPVAPFTTPFATPGNQGVHSGEIQPRLHDHGCSGCLPRIGSLRLLQAPIKAPVAAPGGVATTGEAREAWANKRAKLTRVARVVQVMGATEATNLAMQPRVHHSDATKCLVTATAAPVSHSDTATARAAVHTLPVE